MVDFALTNLPLIGLEALRAGVLVHGLADRMLAGVRVVDLGAAAEGMGSETRHVFVRACLSNTLVCAHLAYEHMHLGEGL